MASITTILTDTAFWSRVAFVFGGYFAAGVASSTIGAESSTTIPPEAYGLVIMIVGIMFIGGGRMGRGIAYGGGFWTAQALLQRTGVDPTAPSLSNNNSTAGGTRATTAGPNRGI